MNVPIPENESERLAALAAYQLFDTPPEEAFDRITRFVTAYFEVPIALISLVGEKRRWIKSRQGMKTQETSREVAFCAHTILKNEPLVVPDATLDPQFADHPGVLGAPHIRFYAGAPLRTEMGLNVGSLCAIDNRPREVSDEQIGVLQDLAKVVIGEMEARRLSQESVRAQAEEHLRTEKALRESEARFRDFADVSSDWFWEMGPDLRFSWFSEGYLKRIGLPIDSLIGRTRWEIANSDESDPIWARHKADLEARRPFSDLRYEVSVESGDKGHRTVSGRPVFDEAGNFRGYRGTATDITGLVRAEQALQAANESLERRVVERTIELQSVNDALKREIADRSQAEAALRESENQLRAITDNLPVMISYLDSQVRYRFANRTCEEWYGISVEDLIGKTAAEVHGSRYSIFAPNITAVLAGQDVVFENSVPYPDGVTRDVRITYVAHKGEAAKVLGFFALIEDITAQKEMDRELAASEQRLRQAVELANLGFWIWDVAEDRCIYCSEENARIHGVSVDEYISSATPIDGELTFTYAEDRELYRKAIRALRQGKGSTLEYRVVTPSGAVRHVREIMKPVFDENGAVVQEVGTIQDMTDVKRAEEQLRQAQKMEIVGQMTGGVAHDFNNLLTIILGHAEDLRERLDAKDGAIGAVIRATERGAELTKRLLAFSRQQALEPKAIDLDALVSGVTHMLQRTLSEEIEIVIHGAPGLWRAYADPGQVENALVNLAVNARDAMPQGGRLTIETTAVKLDAREPAVLQDLKPGNYVVLSVSDTGCGIAPEALEHVFEPFYTTKEVGQGTGLGLSMVYGFAKQSGGQVTIYSEEGRGTTVRLYLPVPRGQGESPGSAQPGAQPESRGGTILVVEDEPEVRQIVISMVQRLGYGVLEAKDGASALVQLQSPEPIDLLLCDMVLPGGMNGPDIARTAREHRPGIKILFMSGYAESALRHHDSMPAAAEILSKPFQRARLAQALHRILQDQGA